MSEKMKDEILAIIDDMKGKDVAVYPVSEIVKYTDWAIVVTGTSSTHLKAIADKVEVKMKEKGIRAIGVEGLDSANWVLQDFGGVVVHIMTADAREFYQLEKLFI